MEVAFGTRHIALPTIYFFDRDEHISTNVRVDSSGICKVVVDVWHSAHRGTDGLNEFLKAMLGKEHGFRADLLSVSLFQTEYSVDVPAPLVLVEKLTMPELASRFPSDLTALTRLEVKGQQPLFALVPACFSWNTVKTLEDFIGHSKVEWE